VQQIRFASRLQPRREGRTQFFVIFHQKHLEHKLRLVGARPPHKHLSAIKSGFKRRIARCRKARIEVEYRFEEKP
jgi:hypothetical protein